MMSGLAVAQEPPQPLLTGRCSLDLPLDAGQGFDGQRFLVLSDRTCRFALDASTGEPRWRLLSRTREAGAATASGLFRSLRKWRDGALWSMEGRRISRWDPALRRWLLQAEPALEFMDFDVDMTGRILLVCTADPRTRTYRALLEAVEDEGRRTTILAPYPDPGAETWARTLSPVAAATLQAGYESVQVQEFTLLFNPLSRRLFIFRPLEDRIHEVKLGLPVRAYQDLKRPGPMDDLCWQVLPKGPTEAWVILKRPDPAGFSATPLELYEGTTGDPVPLPGLHLPLFPDPSGKLLGLEEALGAYGQPAQPLS
jgi:hypothetical protein